MYHGLLQSATFWSFLFSIDLDLAAKARQNGCACGGRLHCAHYARKPRGGGAGFPDSCSRRLSFCCDREGCRKRLTPPSVRFLGRKVYLGAVVILVAAMRHGPSPPRVAELSRLLGVDRRTIARWQVFWNESFPQTPFWKVARGRFASLESPLPGALVEAFLPYGQAVEGWALLLLFLSPITAPRPPQIENSG